mmetsp:Transcript_58734/g.184216  ORF Transcript_58734/g.184216 Transcript_58734/m.184216 type:complete len:268 (-) Transcript_58734:194-997(-)
MGVSQARTPRLAPSMPPTAWPAVSSQKDDDFRERRRGVQSASGPARASNCWVTLAMPQPSGPTPPPRGYVWHSGAQGHLYCAAAATGGCSSAGSGASPAAGSPPSPRARRCGSPGGFALPRCSRHTRWPHGSAQGARIRHLQSAQMFSGCGARKAATASARRSPTSGGSTSTSSCFSALRSSSGVADAPGALTGNTRASGRTSENHGWRQPTTGGNSVSPGLKAQTVLLPTCGPKHQPQCCGPSRSSQKKRAAEGFKWRPLPGILSW